MLKTKLNKAFLVIGIRFRPCRQQSCKPNKHVVVFTTSGYLLELRISRLFPAPGLPGLDFPAPGIPGIPGKSGKKNQKSPFFPQKSQIDRYSWFFNDKRWLCKTMRLFMLLDDNRVLSFERNLLPTENTKLSMAFSLRKLSHK